MKCNSCNKKVNKSFSVCPYCSNKLEHKEIKKIPKKYFVIGIGIILVILSLVTFLFLNRSLSVEEVRKFVVKINVYNENDEVIKTGSGFIIFDENILVTNAHVITGGTKVDAISEEDIKLFVDGAIYYSQDQDIAILKLDNQNNLKPLKYEKNYISGEEVIAIGSPLGIKNSVSDGVISNIDDNLIQHSAPISSGSSGGALFNSKGRLIGMNTATITEGQNINIAISINQIADMYEESKKQSVKSIKEIQLNDDDVIKTAIFNNNAGTAIINNLKKQNNNIQIRNEFSDFENIPELSFIYDNQNYYNNAIVIWGMDDTTEVEDPNSCTTIIINGEERESCATNRVLNKESTMQEIVILHSLDNSEEFYEYTKSELLKRANYLNNMSYNDFFYSHSKEYSEASKNPVIGKINNYIYMIISTDKNFINQLEESLLKLP